MKTLSIYKLGALRYGIWENGAPVVLKPGDMHWLPPISPHIAAIGVRGDRPLTLFDLAACLGLGPIARDRQSYGLLEPPGTADGSSAAFIIPETAGRVVVDPKDVFPLPECLTSPVIKTYTIYDSKPIAVIDTRELFQRIQSADFRPLQCQFSLSGLESSKAVGDGGFTLIETADEVFALPVMDIEAVDPIEAAIHPLQPVPTFVAGLGFCKGQPVPVVDLAERLQLIPTGTPKRLLDVALAEQRFRLRIDARLSDLAAEAVEVLNLAPLLQTPWRQAAAVCKDRIYPVLNVAGLFGPDADADPVCPDYTTTSAFPSQFRREEVEVVEFDIWGSRHALPGHEVTASIRMRPVCPLTETKPLVAGVSEHNGELLPVLDLLRCFGRRAEPTPDWQMIAVANGDFKALILTERIHSSRFLPVDQQRELPFENPEALVYGCYPEDAIVRLIFNTHAMAIHFDRMRHVEFFHALARVAQRPNDAPADAEKRYSADDSEQLLEAGEPNEDQQTLGALNRIDAIESAAPEEEPTVTESAMPSDAALPQPVPPREDEDRENDEIVEAALPVADMATSEGGGSAHAPPSELEGAVVEEERPQPDDEKTRENFEDSSALPSSPAEVIASAADSSELGSLPPGESSLENLLSDIDVGSSDETVQAPVEADALSSEAPADGSDEADDIGGAEVPTGSQFPDEDGEDEAPSELEDIRRLMAPADSDAGPSDETPLPDPEAAPEESPTAGTEIEGLVGAMVETDSPEIGHESGDPELLVDAEPLSHAPERASDASTEEELLETDLRESPDVDPVSAELTEAPPTSEDIQNQGLDSLDAVGIDRVQAAEERVAADGETDGCMDEDSEQIPWLEPMAEDPSVRDAATQPESAAGDLVEEALPSKHHHATNTNKRPRKRPLLLAAAMILLLLFFLSWRFEWLDFSQGVQTVRRKISNSIAHSPPAEKAVTSHPVPKSSPPAAPEPVPVDAVDEEALKSPPTFQAEPLLEPGQIKILDKDGRLVIYRVKRGDTLWGISKRYTGSGFNYPKLAEDNEIRNPDLIFPKQRITVK